MEERHTDTASATSVPWYPTPERTWRCEGESKGTEGPFLGGKQVHFRSAMPTPCGLLYWMKLESPFSGLHLPLHFNVVFSSHPLDTLMHPSHI